MLAVLRAVPLLLVLDGLEVVQEGPAGDGFGRLLDGTLREVLAGACQQRPRRAGGADQPVPVRRPGELRRRHAPGCWRCRRSPRPRASALLAAAGGGWLAEAERRDLVAAVDGHALAVGVLAGLLADRPPASDLAALRAELAAAARTDARVGKVLEFYADRLAEPDRYLLAAVSLFARPGRRRRRCWRSPGMRRSAAGWPGGHRPWWRPRCGTGWAGWPPGTPTGPSPPTRWSATPSGRWSWTPPTTAAETALTGMPDGTVTSRADALRVVEAIELLLDAGQWQPADDLYRDRSGNGQVWMTLPAARLGQRAATAFVATPARRDACATHLAPRRLGFYLNEVGLFAMHAGDLATAREYLPWPSATTVTPGT